MLKVPSKYKLQQITPNTTWQQSPLYIVGSVCGKLPANIFLPHIARAETKVSFNPVLTAFQLAPVFVEWNTPLPLCSYKDFSTAYSNACHCSMGW
jgi:hypothetical protein